MPTLATLELKQAYHKPEDDIARAFYLPCLARATRYDRAVGFFSSAIYALAWPSLKDFVARGGRIRLICSPVLSPDDVAAMNEGYSARSEARQGEFLKAEFQKLLTTPGTVKPARVLAALVALEVVDFRIAWVGAVAGGQPRRLFHDKLGIFHDDEGHTVTFKGSMNETWPGLALDGNLESVDVYVSWAGERELSRLKHEQRYFDRLWSGDYPGVTTVPLPQVVREELLSTADPEHWRELVDEICVEIDLAAGSSPDRQPGGRLPRPHQAAALEAWRACGRRGILKHATGSGKTFTALCAIREALDRGEVPVVLVPSDLLFQQWARELKALFEPLKLRLLLCGGGYSDWRQDGRLRAWTRPGLGGVPRAVLATLQTAATTQFLARSCHGPHLFLVADEVHRLGATQARQVLQLETGPRLGLSATPERAGDPTGTAAVFEYFGGIVPPPFTLFEAIKAGTLTPYAYHVHSISLESGEQEKWAAVTKEIRRLFAQAQQAKKGTSELGRRIKHLLIRRARIVKSAHQKLAAAVSIVTSSYRSGERWIVYCDDQTQLVQVRAALEAAGCTDVLEYHTAMAGDPRRTLDLFEERGGVLVSIRCLDEGVDLPAVSHALILASSKNPREYVQRRGRVLRKFPGKSLAHIHDVLVTPPFGDGELPTTAILEGEFARAIEFGMRALNPGCITDLQRLASEHQLDWMALTAAGLEDDDENEPAEE